MECEYTKCKEGHEEREKEREYDLNLIFHDCLKDFSQINVTLYPSQCQPERVRGKQERARTVESMRYTEQKTERRVCREKIKQNREKESDSERKIWLIG